MLIELAIIYLKHWIRRILALRPRVMGLKVSRLGQFWAVYREETRDWGFLDRIFKLLALSRTAFLWHLGFWYRPDRKTWRERQRVCRKCPVWDRTLRRCRPYSGSKLGCGCFTPYVSQSEEHCWGYEATEGEIGW